MLILKNARVLDADHERDDGRYSIVIDGDAIREVTREPVEASGAQVIDVGGKTVMPGMIDCHVHVIASVAHLGNNSRLPNTFAVLRAVPILAGMLDRGFTTVRDAGGADYALSRAIEDGVIAGPRLFVAGKALSQTGGHGDFRERFDNADPDPCGCNRNMGAIGRVVDGVDEMRKAVREEMRAGANHIKIMGSGGVASPTDPIGNLQFSVDEVKAAVEEAESHQTYVMAHAYTAKAIARVVKLGVRTIEHGNLIDEDAARVMAEHGAYAVPTLVTYDAMSKVGAQMGLAQDTLDKNESVRKRGLEALAMLHERGVKIGLGSDLFGDMHQYQSDELSIRANIVGAFEAIRQATAIGAEIVNMKGKLGVVAAGAYADLLVVDGDPLKDIRVLTGQGERIAGVMKNGAWVREKLL
ncbi:amidohydrolase family protein [Caballeronia sp. LZ008]|uniref:metal-dependent hydrolase family protein n=1 Tax=unclassified Caballeronia TaxID=2646786 RepID=UPI002027B7F4|nr:MULTISPECIES: amidohydrolase family protein [unclassified Caballeronia]MDR5795588.1 amidohydrolase family protein [Caballeronia sp. LZ008]